MVVAGAGGGGCGCRERERRRGGGGQVGELEVEGRRGWTQTGQGDGSSGCERVRRCLVMCDHLKLSTATTQHGAGTFRRQGALVTSAGRGGRGDPSRHQRSATMDRGRGTRRAAARGMRRTSARVPCLDVSATDCGVDRLQARAVPVGALSHVRQGAEVGWKSGAGAAAARGDEWLIGSETGHLHSARGTTPGRGLCCFLSPCLLCVRRRATALWLKPVWPSKHTP